MKDDSLYTIAAPVNVARVEVSRFTDYLALTKPRLVSLVLLTTVIGFVVGSGANVSFMGLLHVLIGTALVAGPCEMNRVTDEPFGTFAAAAGFVPIAMPAGTPPAVTSAKFHPRSPSIGNRNRVRALRRHSRSRRVI